MPVSDTYIEKDSSINEEIDKLRIKTTSSLISRKDIIIIASVSSIFGLGSPNTYREMLIKISKGDILNIKDFFKSLVAIHYLRNDMVLQPGNFRVRGDVIDVFPLYADYPIRIELFGDLIENIIRFDSITGKIIDTNVDSEYIYPAKHFVVSDNIMKEGIEKIKEELFVRLKEFRDKEQLLEAQRLEQRTMYDIEMMMELGYCSGIENYSRYLDGRIEGQRPFCLFDFFSDDFLLIIDESHVTIPQLRAMYNGDRSRKINLVEHGFRLPSALDNRPMKFEEFIKVIDKTIYVSATPAAYELSISSKNVIRQIIRPTGLLDPQIIYKKSKNQIDNLIENIKNTINKNEKILITTLTKRMSEDLTDYLKSLNFRAEYLHSEIDTLERVKILRGLRLNEFDILIGINLLREGLDLPEVSLVAVLDADKQGFLRSKTSLMQVAGRASRNINGKVLLYGDTISEAMNYLMEETKRRRKLQIDHNNKNNIIPKTIFKSQNEIKDTTIIANNSFDKILEFQNEIELSNIDLIETEDLVKKIRKKMLNYAKELKFEEAALLRDQLEKLELNKKGFKHE